MRPPGSAERMVIEELPGSKRITVGAVKGYDAREFIAQCQMCTITPHVAQKAKHSGLDARTTRHAAYEVSQRVRMRVEEVFG